MKISYILAGLVLIAPMALLAGGPNGGDRQHGQHHDKMTAELGLSAQQQAQADAIHSSTREQAKVLSEAHRTEMKTLHENAMADFAKILNPEQLQKMQANQAKRMEYRQNRAEHRENRQAKRAEGKAAAAE